LGKQRISSLDKPTKKSIIGLLTAFEWILTIWWSKRIIGFRTMVRKEIDVDEHLAFTGDKR